MCRVCPLIEHFPFLCATETSQDGVLDALRHVCEEVGCVENQREAAALLCALAVPYENKLPLAESGSAEPLMLMCQSADVEVRLRPCTWIHEDFWVSVHFQLGDRLPFGC